MDSIHNNFVNLYKQLKSYCTTRGAIMISLLSVCLFLFVTNISGKKKTDVIAPDSCENKLSEMFASWLGFQTYKKKMHKWCQIRCKVKLLQADKVAKKSLKNAQMMPK